MAKLALSEGVNGHLPQIYRLPDNIVHLDEGQSKYTGMTIDEYKNTSCCFFLSFFLGDQKWGN